MSSKFKVLSVALVALFALTFYSATSNADVTGSFGVHVSFNPIPCQYLINFDITGFPDQPCEKTFFKIDLQTALDVNISISGLTIGLHSHAGVTGFEDIILSFATTLGALEITDTFVFAQAFAIFPIDENLDGDFTDPWDEKIPTCLETTIGSGVCQTLFVKKRVEMSIALGGVTFSNLAMFEDTTFPNYCMDFFIGDVTASLYEYVGCLSPIKGVDTPLMYNSQSQNFGFGDVISIEGQTPSGITVRSESGICAEQLVNAIKKHVWDFTVNIDCYSGAVAPSVKPPVLFSFEKLYIEGIPLAAGLTLDVAVLCGSLEGSAEVGVFFPCNIYNTLTITGNNIFPTIIVTFGFNDILGPGTFSNIVVLTTTGPLLLQISFNPLTLTPSDVFAQVTFTINPDTNPGTLRIRAMGGPALYFMDFRLSVKRAGLSFYADLDLDLGGTTWNFDDLTLGLTAETGIVTTSADIVIKETNTTPEGAFLLGGNVYFTVNF